MKDIMRALFLGDGVILIQLPVVAFAGFILSELATAFGKGNVSKHIHLATYLVCILLILRMAGKVLLETFGWMGVE